MNPEQEDEAAASPSQAGMNEIAVTIIEAANYSQRPVFPDSLKRQYGDSEIGPEAKSAKRAKGDIKFWQRPSLSCVPGQTHTVSFYQQTQLVEINIRFATMTQEQA